VKHPHNEYFAPNKLEAVSANTRVGLAAAPSLSSAVLSVSYPAVKVHYAGTRNAQLMHNYIYIA